MQSRKTIATGWIGGSQVIYSVSPVDVISVFRLKAAAEPMHC